MKKKKIELLAPAGDLERAKVAIRYGADAVYLGGKRFSLRSRSSNFEIEDIREAVKFANQYSSAIHVTVNMIPHNDDLEGLEEYLIQLEEAGVTAIIAASPTIITTAKKVASKLEVHLSTQMSSTNLDCIQFYQEMGVDRVVLGRECSMKEIQHIATHSPVEIEAFIHGGMCVNYSGRCTLSNAMTLRDANRGGCAQSCRWKYHLLAGNEVISDPAIPFSMSSKDLLAFPFIQPMMEAGVASLKIEGRMKSAYYIATVVKTYRMLIDEILENPNCLTPQRIQYYANEFAKAENRPTSFGFLEHIPSHQDHLYGVNGAGVTHDFLALVLNYDKENGLAVLQVRNHFKKGEVMEVFGPHIHNQCFEVKAIWNQDQQQIELCNKPMEIVKVAIPFVVEAGDMIRRGVTL